MAVKATVRQLQCAALFVSRGYAPSGAAAIVGNFSQESGIHLISQMAKLNKEGGGGIGQWNGDRLIAYKAFVRVRQPNAKDIVSHFGRLDYQVEFAVQELSKMSALDASLRKGGSVSALTADFCWQFERPSKAMANLANRVQQAQLVFASMPSGAPKAAQENVKAAIDKQTDVHDTAAIGGAGTAIGGAVIAGAGVTAHAAPHLQWWVWVALGIGAFLAVVGVGIWLGNRTASKRLAQARLGANDTVVTKVPDVPVMYDEKSEDGVVDTSAARTEEEAAINKAMNPQPQPSEPKRTMRAVLVTPQTDVDTAAAQRVADLEEQVRILTERNGNLSAELERRPAAEKPPNPIPAGHGEMTIGRAGDAK